MDMHNVIHNVVHIDNVMYDVMHIYNVIYNDVYISISILSTRLFIAA